MAKNAGEDPAASGARLAGPASAGGGLFLQGPHDRPILLVALRGGEDLDMIVARNHWPVRLIDEMKLARHSHENWMVGWSDDFQVDGSVNVFGFLGIRGEADPV